mmetsp:Transcript_7691/g.14372  ORF Transcript_7691/g.14372 Transcript_7691/m.14372 type:complete len:93 (+) Transcript_7691:233-511(+)
MKPDHQMPALLIENHKAKLVPSIFFGQFFDAIIIIGSQTISQTTEYTKLNIKTKALSPTPYSGFNRKTSNSCVENTAANTITPTPESQRKGI